MNASNRSKCRVVAILRFVAFANLWLLICSPLSAQQAIPSLEEVLDEGLVAYKALAERDAEAEDLSFDSYAARGLLTYALLRTEKRERVDELFSDDRKKRQVVATTEDLLVELTGKVPKLASGMAATEELIRRNMICMSLARRGDFDAAYQQIDAFPEHPRKPSWQINSYKFVVERQLEQQDLPGAQKTVRKLWSCIRDLNDTDALRKTFWLIKLAKATHRAGEKAPAQKLCLMADDKLSQLRETEEGDVPDINEIHDAMRELAIAHATSGNAAQARELLRIYQEESELLETDQTKAEARFTIRVAQAQVAELSGQRDEALAGYASAMTWAKQINHDTARQFADKLDDSGFVSGILSLGEGVHFGIIAQGQLQAGDKQAALATWEQMPLCFQKLGTLLQMAKLLHKRGATQDARELVARCTALDGPELAAEDSVMVAAVVANIHREIEDEETAIATIKRLAGSPRLKDSLAAKKIAAGALIDFRAFREAYRVIQTIEPNADRAVPLAKLAEGLVKAW